MCLFTGLFFLPALECKLCKLHKDRDFVLSTAVSLEPRILPGLQWMLAKCLLAERLVKLGLR